ncbi:MAG: hypothetical protein COV29_03205 [Candidatus Yanofskybacteria bacterium CG10_big_fil_rev_8_21_14_0_10_36_16]|uniref:Uncharacterized protein n=1 Tax=Candidatus Yanofskybacteria bacterium CG10_big_fil_rev_8_21_14_0_10_36_16 TaxID=1975096 RepID=A0A2J0Q6Y5_9BACT|nr:MAG: hypothetical protein COV29_03205 [Candidatus Yanofskybacteria bacterium CG10_big_fil_rev_8_21_14_0_10_36_16]
MFDKNHPHLFGRLITFIFAFWLIIGIALFSLNDTPAEINQAKAQTINNVGAYFWAGNVKDLGGGFIKTGETLLEGLGSSIIRISMSPRFRIDYNLGGGCISNFSLETLAKGPDLNPILTNPSFSTIIITAYDGTSFSDCETKNYLYPDLYTPEITAAIEQEYKALAQYLGTIKGKTFIILNWEGDNDIYCGTAYGATANSCPNYQKHIEGFTKWINARTKGIKSAGVGNVYSGVEFNIVRYLKNAGLPSILYDVIPNVAADYFSYSSYESINELYSGDNGTKLLSDITTAKSAISAGGGNNSNFIIGEYGFETLGREDSKNKLETVTNLLHSRGVRYAIVWNLLDSGGGFGLYDSNAVLTPSGKYVCSLYQGSACFIIQSPSSTPTPAITQTPKPTTTTVPTNNPCAPTSGFASSCIEDGTKIITVAPPNISNSNLNLTISIDIPANKNSVIWPTGYYWSATLKNWAPFTLQGNNYPGSSWLVNSASTTLSVPYSNLQPGINYIVTWDYIWDGSKWLGPPCSTLTNSLCWRLETFIRP